MHLVLQAHGNHIFSSVSTVVLSVIFLERSMWCLFCVTRCICRLYLSTVQIKCCGKRLLRINLLVFDHFVDWSLWLDASSCSLLKYNKNEHHPNYVNILNNIVCWKRSSSHVRNPGVVDSDRFKVYSVTVVFRRWWNNCIT